MKCPDCQQELKRASFQGVNIDECTSCGGKWFDRDELKKAIDSKDNYLRWLDFNVFEDVVGKYTAVEGSKICPKCSAKLTTKEYSESHVLIGVCPACGGVWLDKNEFQKIISYLEHVVVTDSEGEYAKQTVKKLEVILTGTQSKISEIKDFIAVVKLFELKLLVDHPWASQLSSAVNAEGVAIGI